MGLTIKTVMIVIVMGCINNKEIIKIYKGLDITLGRLVQQGDADALRDHLSSLGGTPNVIGAVNEVNESGWPPLHMAIQTGHKEVVEVLLEAGADKNKVVHYKTPMDIAIQRDYAEVVELLLKAGVDKNKAIISGCTPLWHACSKGYTAIVKVLLKADASTYIADQHNQTPLMMARHHGFKEIIQLLKDHGKLTVAESFVSSIEDDDAKSFMEHFENDYTRSGDSRHTMTGVSNYFIKGPVDELGAFAHLAKNGKVNILKALFQRETQERAEGHKMYPLKIIVPMEIAALSGNVEILKMSFSVSAKPQLANAFLVRAIGPVWPLTQAIRSGSSEAVKWMIKNKHNIGRVFEKKHFSEDRSRATDFSLSKAERNLAESAILIPSPISSAADTGDSDIVETIITSEYNEDYTVGQSSRLAAHHACQKGSWPVLELLMKHDYKVNECDEKGYTPLCYAVELGNIELVEKMLDSGYIVIDGKALDIAKGEIKKILIDFRNGHRKRQVSPDASIVAKGRTSDEEEKKQSEEAIIKEVDDLLFFDDDLKTKNRCEAVVIKDKIGEGHYGEVFLGSYRNKLGEEMDCAVKTATSDKEHALVQEGEIMKDLQHTNIINMLDMLRDPARLVLEYMPGGSLKGFLDKRRPDNDNLSSSMANIFAQQITSGMGYLSDENIIHRDLSARNILMKPEGEGHLLKITDFGVSRDLPEEDEYYKAQSQTELPWRWMPVEALSDRQFTLKTDVWSYGVLLWEIMSLGRTPYEEYPTMLKVIRQLDKGKRLEIEGVWKDRYSLLSNQTARCWEEEPSSRPSFEVLNEELSEEARMAKVYEAIKTGNVSVIKEYLKEGNVNKVDEKGNILLHHAVLNNQIVIIRLLMKNVADVSLRNKEDKSSIDLAKEMNNQDILEILCPDAAAVVDPEYI